MASSKDRQRALARAKLDRQLARRASRERRKRRIQAGLGAALAVALIVGGVAWLGGMFDESDEPEDTAASNLCAWTPQSAESNTDLKDVGTPPTTGIPTSGTAPMTVTTNQGAPITVALDLANAPCSGASLTYLAQKKFYDNTECHEITAEGALHCGDPKGTGLGGPTYTFYNENVPTAPAPEPSASTAPPPAKPLYPKGTVALWSNPPGNNGSQFLIFLKDYAPKSDPQYPIVGTVTAGLNTLNKIGKIATVDNGSGDKVKPKEKVVVQSVTVGAAAADTPPAPAPSASSQS
ncbi:peptidylprolyl isomerase [Jidongwangia harbinensis]|uniref:peptidylprolyl isomerase n=1 Tax=Jidongwangia harbinensis TaxID=2878561 RepID=UPI001CD9B3BA|nr:peptidylprolyl isomerase [Jidongwangia harbinensis]MCA2214706.1 peptidylprolyl isomerase [Jidongwangia harbinensis]